LVLHWWSSVLLGWCENPERASRHERGGGPPLNFYDAWVNLTDLLVPGSDTDTATSLAIGLYVAYNLAATLVRIPRRSRR
jgi:hypothetical protein